MWRTSYALRLTSLDDTNGATANAPTEQLSDVYLCASSPPVIEEWAGWPYAPYVVAGGMRHYINQRGPLPWPASSTSPVLLAGGTNMQSTGEAFPSPESSAVPPGVIPLSALCRAYEAADERSGSAFLQVYPTGAHGLLSPEAKAMLAGCTMFVLRSRLSHLLRLLPHGHCNEGEDDLDMSAVAVLSQYCCASRAVPAPSPSALRSARGMNNDGGHARGQRWVITWAVELVACVAASLKAAGMPLRVSDCGQVIRTSLHFGLGAKLQRDAAAEDDGSAMASSTAHTPATGRCPCYAALSVQLIECALAPSHPLDVCQAVDLTRFMYVSHVHPAQAHAEDGTEAYQRLIGLASRVSDPLQLPSAQGAWEEALQSYQSSAVSAQRGVLFVLTHDVSAQSGPAALLPLTAREERSRAHAAEKLHTLVLPPALRDYIFASLRVRSAPAYFNHVLLCHAWSSDDAAAEAHARRWADRLANDEALAPARVAVEWRASLRDAAPYDCVFVTSNVGAGQTLAPTPLQWVLYTARRQLVIAVANRSQTVLTGRRLGLGRAAAAATNGTNLFSISALRALAEQCVKALPIARGLLGWHCPWPVPSCVQSTTSGAAVPSAAAVEEVLWALRMLGKLRWRAALLYEAAGDLAEQHRQLRALRDDVQRWSSRRRARALAADGVTLASGNAACTSTLEDIVCHVDDGDWSVLIKELSSMLPPA
ncbi:hypothetical protein LSCM1_07024 [Leishmania martiniquensis]|uniref:Uncharacterized protein n=1 Tax=Leishmania martiniquensis TaxID=1580590 RepID=A0A836HYP8_9TRYP|nr:hypothetical protein LSCM1_07024 [Leishmania martiniquensis]